MTDVRFVPNITPITADWLNDVNTITNGLGTTTGSGRVGWIRNAIGAVATTLAKWTGWQPLSPFEFMTDAQITDVQAGTLLLDVTSALQKAIDAVALRSSKGMVWLPAGKYKLTSALNIPYGVSIRGEGATASELVCFNCNGLNFTSYGYEIGSMFFENFGISSGAGTNYSAIVTLPNASTMDGLHFHRLRFYGLDVCFSLAANWNCNIQQCTAQNVNVFVAASGVIVGLRIMNNRIVYAAGGAGSSAKIAIDLRNSTIQESIHILNNQIYGFDVCVSEALAAFVNILHNDLSGIVTCIAYTTANGVMNINDNYIEAFGVGIAGAAQGVDTPTTKVNIKNNSFISQGGTGTIGIVLNTSSGTYQFNTSIEDNSFSQFLTHDIKLWAPGRTRVENNRCMSTAPTYSIWTAGVIAGPVKIARNWCKKAIYIDVAADVTSGKLVLDANTESDTFVPYRGTFTPAYTSQAGAFGAITYTYSNGSYERIGNLCFFNLTIVAATMAAGTASTGVYISLGNIPFTAATTVQATALAVGDASGWGANTPSSATLLSGTKNISLNHRATANGATVATQVSDMTMGAGNRITIAGVFLCT